VTTDRRPRGVRLVIVTDRTLVPAGEVVPRLAAAIAAVPPGAVAVQVRDKDLDGGPLLALVRSIVPLGAPVWVNDRLDVALVAGAAGVHLPERGLTVTDARRAAAIICGHANAIAIGCSRHTADACIAADAEQADLVQLGPIWPTPSKTGAVLGPEILAVRRALSARVHLVAVGGIETPERARAAFAAGADAVAVIRAFWTAPDPAAAAAALVAAGDDLSRE
jgi:thiamine-phosphate pyrophosphorylase